MDEHAVIEAAREFVRADESEVMAARHNDATARRSAMERRAVALAKLKEAVTAYDAAAGRPVERAEASAGSSRA
jgi:hypothetical protein